MPFAEGLARGSMRWLRWLRWGLLCVGLLATSGPVAAWGNHSLLAYRAFEHMPEVAQAPAVRAEPLDEFLRDQEPALARLLDEQEAWARTEIQAYRPRPEALRWRPNPKHDAAARRLAFLRALRLSPQARFALFLQRDPRQPDLIGLPLLHEAVSTVALSKGATQQFEALPPWQPVSALAVLASACDEPDYGLDVDLFDEQGSDYGLGPQPFGNPAIRISSQAPFHMGFFHQGAVFNRLAPAFTRSFAPLRFHQYSTLAALAFRSGHPYWGWRFSGLALHYVQDLAQPYHASAAPGASLSGMVWANLLAAMGLPDRKAGLVVLQSNRHFVLERFQTQWALAAALARQDGPSEQALRDLSLDARYPAWSPAYLREVVAAEAHAAGPRTDAAVVVGAPARYVLDPGFDFGANEAGIDLDAETRSMLKAQRERLQAVVAELLGHFGAHSRNSLRAILRAGAQRTLHPQGK